VQKPVRNSGFFLAIRPIALLCDPSESGNVWVYPGVSPERRMSDTPNNEERNIPKRITSLTDTDVSGLVKMYDLRRFENAFVNLHARCVARLGRHGRW
jgi:hypothetical protein